MTVTFGFELGAAALDEKSAKKLSVVPVAMDVDDVENTANGSAAVEDFNACACNREDSNGTPENGSDGGGDSGSGRACRPFVQIGAA